MSFYCFEEDRFFEYAMKLFFEAGHAVTTDPEYINHSSEQLVYFDCRRTVSLSNSQRESLHTFSNVSRLFSFNNCTFFSIVLLTTKKERSQAAHDIHSLLHPGIESKGTICIFKCDDEVVLSFMGFGLKCILSDWYPIDDDFDVLFDRLHVVNMSLDRDADYFSDMLYSLARNYYFAIKDPTVYELIPIDFFSGKAREDVDRDELNQIVLDELLRIQAEYGDDYVEYDDSDTSSSTGINADLDMMLLEMKDADDELGNPFDEVIDDSDDDAIDEEDERDVYEFDDVDPEIFKDPKLMVKFLEKASLSSSNDVDESDHEDYDSVLLSLLDREGVHYVDNRDKGGALWIIGGHELDTVMLSCETLGFNFTFTEKGGRATKGFLGWYLRSHDSY